MNVIYEIQNSLPRGGPFITYVNRDCDMGSGQSLEHYGRSFSDDYYCARWLIVKEAGAKKDHL